MIARIPDLNFRERLRATCVALCTRRRDNHHQWREASHLPTAAHELVALHARARAKKEARKKRKLERSHLFAAKSHLQKFDGGETQRDSRIQKNATPTKGRTIGGAPHRRTRSQRNAAPTLKKHPLAQKPREWLAWLATISRVCRSRMSLRRCAWVRRDSN